MIYGTRFSVNLLQLSAAVDKHKIIDDYKRQGAMDLGLEICKSIPFSLNKERSFERERVPNFNEAPIHMFSNPPQEIYENEIFATSSYKWEKFVDKLGKMIDVSNLSADQKKYIGSLIKDL